ncbi:MAG TPA: hypothetical protein VF338_03700 [Leptolinea sp.]
MAIIEGLFVFRSLIKIRSDAGSGLIAGFSLQRVGILCVIVLALGIFSYFLYDSFRPQKFLKLLVSKLETRLDFEIYHVLIKSFLGLLIISSLAFILFFLVPGLARLIFFFPNHYIYSVIGTNAGLLIEWIFLISLKAIILYFVSGRKPSHLISTPTRLMVVSWTVELFVLMYFALWSFIPKKLEMDILLGPGINVFILSVWFSALSILHRWKGWAGRVSRLLTCVSIWLCVFIASIQLVHWLGVGITGTRGQFVLLASSFLHGKIYLTTLPPNLHDLTFYNGQWYVPYPPFPALILVPLIALWGISAFNLSTFSLMLAATASVTMFLILDELIQLGWIKISRSSALWLTALFHFGTVFWWLSFTSGSSFFSQVVTVLFYGLAFFTVLRRSSPWISGICLAAAILCRPNVFVLWPALLAIAVQLSLKEGKVNWKQVFKWGVFSAIPVVVGVGLLVYYNYLRFGNFLDFGYVTINGSETIVNNVQKYGVFSTHYAFFNFHYMFLALPDLKLACQYYIPRGWGMSIFFTTPAIVYVVRKFKINWWIGGCWVSIILSIILLTLYSNNGANQYGYRYVMDFMIPAIMIIAYNAGNKVSGLLKTLIVASIFINYYGIISWYRSPC